MTNKLDAVGLDELYPRGTQMRMVPVTFRGIPWRRWFALDIERQCTEHAQSFYGRFLNGERPLPARAVQTARDRYGMRGI